MDVGIYTRLSEEKDTAAATHNALERQEERARALTTAKGWTVTEVYTDVDIGAYRAAGKRDAPKRPQFERLLADIERGTIGGVVFLKLERLVRDPGDFARLLGRCDASGAVLCSVTEPIDTSTPMGEHFAWTMVHHARLESANTAARVAWQQEQAARAGKPRHGANRPFGRFYDQVTIHPKEATAIREVVRQLLSGESLRNVTRWLNGQGILAPGGGQWSTVKLRRSLLAPHLAGLRSYHGEIVAKGQWEPIVEESVWRGLTELLTDPERGGRRGRPARWLLVGGLARCGYSDCGAPLVVKRDNSASAKHVYVCESERSRPGWHGCGRISIKALALEEIVTEMVFARDWRHVDQAVTNEEPAVLERAIAADEALLVELSRAHATRRISAPEWFAARDEVAARVGQARTQLAELRQAAAPSPASGKVLREQWPDLSLERRQAILRKLLSAVLVKPSARRGLPWVDPDRVVPIWRA